MHRFTRLLIHSTLILFTGIVFSNVRSSGAEDAGYATQVQQAVDQLQKWYQPATGLWETTGWWNSANALTAVIDYSRATGTDKYSDILVSTLSQHKFAGFLNDYYDDEGWWALAWIDAYDMTHKAEYLHTAASIFNDMAGGWDDTCGGGIWWSKERHYKNAIANELFLDVAAHLANRSADAAQKDKYLTWADREWQWFGKSSMIAADHQINDGLTSACQNNQKTVWSYNQGVILGGLAELSRQPHHKDVIRDAQQVADAAILHLADKDGVLHDPCEPKCGEDGTQFKGIFVRNLTILDERKHERRYDHFFASNASSLMSKARNADASFGVVWSGPPSAANASTQSSAIDALNAALATHAHVHSF